MRYVQVEEKQVVNILELDDETAQDLESNGVELFDAPEYVEVGWTVSNEGDYIPLVQGGWTFDWVDFAYYPHTEYRRILHERTSNDTLEAMRKIREGDKSIDWEAWLNALDAYNLAVEQTKEQTEPVTYPTYPVKPSE